MYIGGDFTRACVQMLGEELPGSQLETVHEAGALHSPDPGTKPRRKLATLPPLYIAHPKHQVLPNNYYQLRIAALYMYVLLKIRSTQ